MKVSKQILILIFSGTLVLMISVVALITISSPNKAVASDEQFILKTMQENNPHIDIKKYPSQDPNYQDNIASTRLTLNNPNRYVTHQENGGYVVSYEDTTNLKGQALLSPHTLFFDKNGKLETIRYTRCKSTQLEDLNTQDACYPRYDYFYNVSLLNAEAPTTCKSPRAKPGELFFANYVENYDGKRYAICPNLKKVAGSF